MKSKWVEHQKKRIFYQDFSKHFFDYEAVKKELEAVQEIIVQEPLDSALVLANFENTSISGDLMSALNASSSRTKSYVHKTAVIGISSIQRKLGDLLSRITGQPLKYFTDERKAKDWLAKDK